jgi:hypothetical protein
MAERTPSSEWDVVDEASLESFPASDPPAWGSLHAAPSESTVGGVFEPGRETRPSRRVRVALIVIAACAAIGGLVVLGSRRRRAHFF